MSFQQTEFFDAPIEGLPGQLVNSQTVSSTTIRSFPAEGAIPMGRAVVKGTNVTADPTLTQAPFKVRLPIDGVSDETDILGVAIRPLIPAENVSDGASSPTDVAGYIDNSEVAILALRSQELIYVELAAGESVEPNQAVQVVINTAGSQTLGSFSQVSTGNTVTVPGAIFYETKTTTASNRIVKVLLNVA